MSKSITDNLREFTTATQEYVEASIQYHKLDLFKSVLKGSVAGAHSAILGFFFLIALFFISIALSIYLGQVFENKFLGYLIVGVFYLVLMIILSLFLKKFLEKVFLRKASAQMFNKTEYLKNEEHENL